MSFGVFFYLFNQVAFKKFKLVYNVSWSYLSMPHLLPKPATPLLKHLFPPPHILQRKAFHLVVSHLLLCFTFVLFCLNHGLTMQPWLVWNSCRLFWPGAHSDALTPTASVLGIKTCFTAPGLLVHVLSCCLYFCVTGKRNHHLCSVPRNPSPLLTHSRGLGFILI